MITFLTGNPLHLTYDYLVVPCNCQGVMGEGFLREVYEKHKVDFEEYINICETKWLLPGRLFTTANCIFMPLQIKWHRPPRMEYFGLGLAALSKKLEELNNKTIVVSALGCYKSGFKWLYIKELLELWESISDFGNNKLIFFAPEQKR